MRLAFLCTVAVFLTVPAGAHEIQLYTPKVSTAPTQLLGADAKDLTQKIGQALLAELGVAKLQSFKVHWNSPSFQCLRVTHEMDDSMVSGVCLVEATAMQVSAVSQLSVQDGQLSVSILSAIVE